MKEFLVGILAIAGFLFLGWLFDRFFLEIVSLVIVAFVLFLGSCGAYQLGRAVLEAVP